MKQNLLILILFTTIFGCSSKQKEYYEDWTLKATGEYKSDLYTECCFAGTCKIPYKIGEWKYYYKNRTLKASGIYDIGQKTIHTNCEGGDTIKFGYANSKWIFFNINGDKLITTNELISKLEINNEDNFYKNKMIN